MILILGLLDKTLDGDERVDAQADNAQVLSLTRSKLIELMRKLTFSSVLPHTDFFVVAVSELLGLWAVMRPRMQILITVRNATGQNSKSTVSESE